MEAHARVRVLVECGAVEARKAVRIGRKVRRHPVEDHADAGSVAAIDQPGESGRFAESRGRREQPDRLVAPRRIQRMLADRHELDMREAKVAHIGDQRVGERVPVKPAVVAAASPRSGMHLVDRHRRAPWIALRSRRDPLLVVPRKAARVADDR